MPVHVENNENNKSEAVIKARIASAASKRHCLLVNSKQRGNPILKFISHVPWEYEDIVPDYQMGNGVCALFLSLRYHNLNPDYIHERLKRLGKMYNLRVLLVQVSQKKSCAV